MNLKKYMQRNPDLSEGVPEKIENNKELRDCKQTIIDLLPDAEKILDIGPAAGWETKQLVIAYGAGAITAVTLFEEEKVEIEKNSGVKTIISDMHGLPGSWSEQFNLVFASHVLEHSPAPYIALSEMFRVLRGKGVLFAVLPNAEGYTGLGGKAPKRIGSFGAHLFVPSVETLLEMAKHVGFEFDCYREVPQWCNGRIHYLNRIFSFRKPE